MAEKANGVLIQQVLESTREAASLGSCAAPLLGECIEEVHPVLQGRIKVGWVDTMGRQQEAWLPSLRSLVVRRGDRVLLTQPANWPEAMVTGVMDGLHQPEPPPRRPGPELRLRTDRGMRITGEGGADLMEIYEGERGPVLRLLSDDLDLEVPGQLRLRAADITLEARRGGVEIKASDDVVVRGEMIELN